MLIKFVLLKVRYQKLCHWVSKGNEIDLINKLLYAETYSFYMGRGGKQVYSWLKGIFMIQIDTLEELFCLLSIHLPTYLGK